MNMKKITLLAVFFCAIFSLHALGTNDSETPEETSAENSVQAETTQIEGLVSLYGNEPFSFPGIETSEGLRYTLVTEDKLLEKKIRKANGRKIIANGIAYLPVKPEKVERFRMLKDGYFFVEDFEIIKPLKKTE